MATDNQNNMLKNPEDIVLVSDVGGTNVRFGLYSYGQESLIEFDGKYKCTEFLSFEEAVQYYLKEKSIKPAYCVVGAAGAIDEEAGEVTSTNTPWKVSIPKLKAQCPFFKKLKLVNDFVLQGFSLPHLKAHEQYESLYNHAPANLNQGKILVYGPGTGLGMSLIIPSEGKRVLATSEGGHSSIPEVVFDNPEDQKDKELLINALHQYYKSPVIEHIVSGTGISNLYHIFNEGAIPEHASLKIPAQQVEKMAAVQKDPIALKAFRFFNTYMGAHAGSMASTLIADQVFFCGGLMASDWVKQQLKESQEFKKYFENRSGMTGKMKNVHFSVSNYRDMATLGAMCCAKELIDNSQEISVSRKDRQDLLHSLLMVKGVIDHFAPDLKIHVQNIENAISKKYKIMRSHENGGK